ncbi:glutamate--tRNA ligase [Patescibacteria group bacterium]|nr:glutamate--tRNA ligase [Patescibacteria group bacterium]
MDTVRTRIAPSPTGFPHIGTIYQVLVDFAFSRQNHGQFVMRLEDTDRARFVEGAEGIIYDAFAWFGLAPDESPKVGGPYAPYRQSERLPLYRKYVDSLIGKGYAYHCFCTRGRLDEMRKTQEKNHQPPMYDQTCLKLTADEVRARLKDGIPYVIRMKVPEHETIAFDDLIAGHIEFDSDVIDHQVILKSDGYPTYHLAVVVDDHLMEISHVFRGKEWISSTPKHVLLYRYFGWDMPVHGHLPLILNEDGKGKLSKRHGHASVEYYRKGGYLPEAVLNYLSNIVWHHPEGKEIYPLAEFIRLFDIRSIGSQAPRFDLKKLDWVNGQYIRALDDKELHERLVAFDASIGTLEHSLVSRTIPLVKERMSTLKEYRSLAGFFFERPKGFERPFAADVLSIGKKALEMTDWDHEAMERAVRSASEKAGIKARDLFMEIRVAVTGKTVGPPLLESLEILGKEETLKRLEIGL